MLTSKGLVVSVVVGAFVGNHAKELVMPSVEQPSNGETFWEGQLGQILGGAVARVID